MKLRAPREPLALHRRQALSVLAGTALCGLLPVSARSQNSQPTTPVFLSSAQLPSGGHAIVALDPAGQTLCTIPLAARGHDFAVRADGLCVAFARRPGTFAVAFRPRKLKCEEPQLFASPPQRHFNGHGAFSPDGRLLYASENDFEAGTGCIGIYKADTLERLGEFPSGGIGPHEIMMLPNGTLAVANGGIETHPDFPRAKLNIETMRPNLAILNPRKGIVLEREELPPALHKLSIRHMAWSQAGETLWFGCQWEGEAGLGKPLVGRYRPGQKIELLPSPTGGWEQMRDYIGSVATTADGDKIAVSSPRGGQVLIWNADDSEAISFPRSDVSGLAGQKEGFALSDGTGHISTKIPHQFKTTKITAFDNHLRFLG